MMQFDPLAFIREMMGTHGVNTLVLKPPYENILDFDEHLRAQLYPAYSYVDIISRLELICEESTIYMVEDEFHVHYVMLKLPVSICEGTAYLFVGPYLTQSQEDIVNTFIQNNTYSLERIAAIKEYFAGMPTVTRIDAIEMEIAVMAKYLFGGEKFAIDNVALKFQNDESDGGRIGEGLGASIRMEVIEERYRIEDDMLKAIELGDHQQALKHCNSFNRFSIESRTADQLRGTKNYFITSNSLMRKAVQQADVHPAHIDHLSSYFARKIEATQTQEELPQIMNDMLRKYCLLVKNHSLRRYSKPIQSVLNYIDFNYVETLSLNMLAELADITANYLSGQFKKEVGTTVIDYINQCRIEHAQNLLITTSLSIGAIAEKVGIIDENYFARIFKKQTGKSASGYRKLYK